jgi:1-acyl-sn-glycerol-3-phosphate acyltransferase
VNRPGLFKAKGPLLLASNHPNGFLDALILGSLFHQPVHFLARGDAFRNPLIRRLLIALQLIPIYRLSEGKENLGLNEASFNKCQQILDAGGIVLIFAEGACQNQWTLRPMKKGTARITVAAINEPGPRAFIQVLPVTLNYNSFSNMGKTVLIHFGETISKKDLLSAGTEREKMHLFNSLLADRLSGDMLQSATHPAIIQTLITNHGQHGIPDLKKVQSRLVSEDRVSIIQKLKMPGAIALGPASLLVNLMMSLLLLLPAISGLLLHIPLYLPVKKIIRQKTKGSVFYDSVLFTALLLAYPVYWLILNIILQPIIKDQWIRVIFLFMPMLAWIFIYWHECFRRVKNYLRLPAMERRILTEMLKGTPP